MRKTQNPSERVYLVDGEFSIPPKIALQLLGVSAQTLNKWTKETDPPKRDIYAGFPAKGLGEFIRRVQVNKPGTGKRYPWRHAPTEELSEKLSINVESARLKKAQADKVEMENEEAAGNLIPAHLVEEAWSQILQRVATRMQKIPVSIAPLLLGDDDLYSIQEKIKDAVNDALSEMSADWRESAHDVDMDPKEEHEL